MGERPDQLRQEVDRKRDDAARKIDEIEQRVGESAQRVQEGVAQTTEQVKATVQDSIQGAQQVTERVKANADWRKQMEERPLVMVGAAFLGGFALGSLTGGEDGGQSQGGRRPPDAAGSSYGGPLYGSQMGIGGQRAPQPPQSQGMGGAGLMTSLRGIAEQSGLQDTLTNSASALISSFSERIRSTLEEQVPGFKEQMQKRSEQSGQAGQPETRAKSRVGSAAR